jgi:predicted GIY-YIG superfamily endonuclease
MSATFEYINTHHKSLIEQGILSTSEPYSVYPDSTKGYVYIIHLARPLAGSRSRHYVGFSTQVTKRLWHHRNNSGSNFLREANRQGIPYALVVVFRGTKKDERTLKNHKNTAKYCPCCNPNNPRIFNSKDNSLLPHEREYQFVDL